MNYGYVRVACRVEGASEREQLQEYALREAGAQIVYRETGTRYNDHPELDKLLDAAQQGDRLIVTKIASLSRDFDEYCRLKEAFREKGVEIRSLEALLDPDLLGPLLIQNYGLIYDTIEAQFLACMNKYRKDEASNMKKEDLRNE